MNWELPDVQAGFRKSRGTRDKIASICWIIEKALEFQKNISFCFIDYTKAFDLVHQNKLWKILKEMGIRDHLTCLLRNPYAGQEVTVRTRHGTTDGFRIGKRAQQGCLCLPAWLTSVQSTSCETLGRMNLKLESSWDWSNPSLRYADDTILMAVKRGNKELLEEGERGEWRSWLKTFENLKSGHPVPSLHGN